MPIQSSGAEGIQGMIEIFDVFKEALKDLDGFSHIYILYHFHQTSGWQPLVKPFLDDQERGLFATRAPKRPNPIGLTVVRLVSVENNTLQVLDIDVLDQTPLLDIKPYVPQFENIEGLRIGWLEGKAEKAKNIFSDSRFK